MADRPSRRGTFGAVVLAAAVSSVALAVAGTQPWFAPDVRAGGVYECEAPCVGLSVEDAASAPAVTRPPGRVLRLVRDDDTPTSR